MRVGYKASAEQFAPGELAAYAIRAEELGFDSVTISDHFQPWRLDGGHAPNSLAWMPWVLARTERVLVGTTLLSPSFRYNPALLAQTCAGKAWLAAAKERFTMSRTAAAKCMKVKKLTPRKVSDPRS